MELIEFVEEETVHHAPDGIEERKNVFNDKSQLSQLHHLTDT